MLSHTHGGEPESFREFGGIYWPFSFQEFCNGATGLSLTRRLRFRAHANISKEFSLQSQHSVLGFGLSKEFPLESKEMRSCQFQGFESQSLAARQV